MHLNPLTGTPLARLRKKELWLGFAGALNQSMPVRKAAKACKVNKRIASSDNVTESGSTPCQCSRDPSR
jgi:hypothetical protein